MIKLTILITFLFLFLPSNYKQYMPRMYVTQISYEGFHASKHLELGREIVL